MTDMQKRIYRTLKNPPILKISSPLQKFIHKEASSSKILLLCILIGLIWINLPFGETYNTIWHTYIGFSVGAFDFNQSLLHWINDGLMAIFFFVIGLELKRELIVGGLSNLKEASLSIVAALGGMILPAMIYLMFNHPGSDGIAGWGIPMSTDIAISIGILALFSYNIPRMLKLLLTSIAIIDDLGSILIIAIFYSSQINWISLLIAALIFGVLIVFNVTGIRNNVFYIILGIFLWFFVFSSGIHATIAGVLLAITIPATKRIEIEEFHDLNKKTFEYLSNTNPSEGDLTAYLRCKATIQAAEKSFKNIQTPLEVLEGKLINIVAFLIVPLFGLANSGVRFASVNADSFSVNVFLGACLGLMIGKPLGMFLFAWIYSKTKFFELPSNINWLQIIGIFFLGGIGFTMSNFIAGLAFSSDVGLLDSAKIGILIASIISALMGFFIIKYSLKSKLKTSE